MYNYNKEEKCNSLTMPIVLVVCGLKISVQILIPLNILNTFSTSITKKTHKKTFTYCTYIQRKDVRPFQYPFYKMYRIQKTIQSMCTTEEIMTLSRVLILLKFKILFFFTFLSAIISFALFYSVKLYNVCGIPFYKSNKPR